ncbi:hypothetical protein D7Y40_07210 [Stenotrophomonas maltophilia]|nr:hypothetical protein [Stenotrophomonas maltophilia]MBA0540005.1 hypothetical protein [Stenotrophomonas maltophilia]QGM10162.1 hypothetical protein FEO84_12935 [Stenotrophomonas maltophilia]REC83673.1 hypothetical protein DXK52_10290 [Stenotrophomonas maltophilia]
MAWASNGSVAACLRKQGKRHSSPEIEPGACTGREHADISQPAAGSFGGQGPPGELLGSHGFRRFRLHHEERSGSTPGPPVTEATLTLWKGRLPDLLLALWQRDGLARYHDDRLTMVDPAQYDAVLDAFLEGSPLRGKDDFHVYAISPFGQMLICGERTGVELTLEPHEGHQCAPAAATLPTSSIDRNRRLHDFLLTLDDPELDVLTEDEEPMFWRVREMLGPLGDGEIYTSTESVSEHGWRLGTLVKRKALDVLGELAQRR